MPLRLSRSRTTLSRRILLARSLRFSHPLCRGLAGVRLLRSPTVAGKRFLRDRGLVLVITLQWHLWRALRRPHRGRRAHRYSDGGIHPRTHRCLRARTRANFRAFSSNCAALRTPLSVPLPKQNFRTVVCVASRKKRILRAQKDSSTCVSYWTNARARTARCWCGLHFPVPAVQRGKY